MEFDVPRGESLVCHIKVTPSLPANGKAVHWHMSTVVEGKDVDVDELDIWFSKNSSKRQRQSERMIIVFTIDEDAQNGKESWRFTNGGVMYCKNKGDYLNRMQFEMSDDGMVLTGTVSCLSDLDEAFNFSFLALHCYNNSGECSIYASADPGGKNGRR